ncbi:hypothetical protein EDC52_104351 [Biostraticola tofi]|uniref:Uncharacterized protein n=1 Tax=Biostraticola tofi TaxID=466109 RepID=A0A4R3YWE3_9GAMM|nr:hypothetical protein EDC52_104351 [Biostraticola tofi]
METRDNETGRLGQNGRRRLLRVLRLAAARSELFLTTLRLAAEPQQDGRFRIQYRQRNPDIFQPLAAEGYFLGEPGRIMLHGMASGLLQRFRQVQYLQPGWTPGCCKKWP